MLRNLATSMLLSFAILLACVACDDRTTIYYDDVGGDLDISEIDKFEMAEVEEDGDIEGAEIYEREADTTDGVYEVEEELEEEPEPYDGPQVTGLVVSGQRGALKVGYDIAGRDSDGLDLRMMVSFDNSDWAEADIESVYLPSKPGAGYEVTWYTQTILPFEESGNVFLRLEWVQHSQGSQTIGPLTIDNSVEIIPIPVNTPPDVAAPMRKALFTGDGNDGLYMAWQQDYEEKRKLWVNYSANGGESWPEVTSPVPVGMYAIENDPTLPITEEFALCADGDSVFVARMQVQGERSRIYVNVSLDEAQAWLGAPLATSREKRVSDLSCKVLDGRMYAIYSVNLQSAYEIHMLQFFMDEGQWKLQDEILSGENSSNMYRQDPELSVVSDGSLIASWSEPVEPVNYQIIARRLQDGLWLEEKRLLSEDSINFLRDHRIVADGGIDYLLLRYSVGSSSTVAMYKSIANLVFDNQNFSPLPQVPGEIKLEVPAFDVDGQEMIIAYIDFDEDDNQYIKAMISHDGGQLWSEPETLHVEEQYPERLTPPKVALASGGAYVLVQHPERYWYDDSYSLYLHSFEYGRGWAAPELVFGDLLGSYWQDYYSLLLYGEKPLLAVEHEKSSWIETGLRLCRGSFVCDDWRDIGIDAGLTARTANVYKAQAIVASLDDDIILKTVLADDRSGSLGLYLNSSEDGKEWGQDESLFVPAPDKSLGFWSVSLLEDGTLDYMAYGMGKDGEGAFYNGREGQEQAEMLPVDLVDDDDYFYDYFAHDDFRALTFIRTDKNDDLLWYPKAIVKGEEGWSEAFYPAQEVTDWTPSDYFFGNWGSFYSMLTGELCWYFFNDIYGNFEEALMELICYENGDWERREVGNVDNGIKIDVVHMANGCTILMFHRGWGYFGYDLYFYTPEAQCSVPALSQPSESIFEYTTASLSAGPDGRLYLLRQKNEQVILNILESEAQEWSGSVEITLGDSEHNFKALALTASERILWLSWLDEKDSDSINLRLAASIDGGKSFTAARDFTYLLEMPRSLNRIALPDRTFHVQYVKENFGFYDAFWQSYP